jgi:hypothetical protein
VWADFVEKVRRSLVEGPAVDVAVSVLDGTGRGKGDAFVDKAKPPEHSDAGCGGVCVGEAMTIRVRLALSGALFVACPIFLTSAIHANPLVDASFESPVIGPPTYPAAPINFVYPGGNLGGWTFSPINNTSVSDNGAGIINATGTSNWWDWPPGSASGSPPSGFSGNQFAFVQGNGSLSQTFTAPSTGSFAVTWLEGSRLAV